MVAKFLSLFVNPRLLLGAFILAVVAFMLHWAFDRGVLSERERLMPRLEAFEARAYQAEGLLGRARTQAERQARAHEAALEALVRDHAALRSQSAEALDRAERNARQLKGKLHDILSLVTPQADRACLVPAGFVWLHDVSARERGDSASAAEGASVSERGPPNADSPSGIALSAVAATVSANYAECHTRLEVLDAWQLWYANALAAWRRAATLQGDFALSDPPTPERSRP